MTSLCEAYWYPVYAFVRRCGSNTEDALDLTQEFFARLVERNDLANADSGRGRFREWLLGAVKHFLSNEKARSSAKKRGGGNAPLSIDECDAEGRYVNEPETSITPEQLYSRRWAMTLLERALDALRADCAARGKSDFFDAVSIFERVTVKTVNGEIAVFTP